MVDAKAPGINLETSEVFETSDLTEADQHYFPADESSDSVETIHISSNEAFGRFKGTFVDTNIVDFSDRIRNTRRKGYIVWKGEEGESKEETPVKKYQRLNCQVRELMDEITEARSSKDSGLQTGTLESLSVQVDLLHKHLLEMRLENVLDRETLETMTDPQAAVRQRLVAQLNQIKSLKADNSSSDISNTQGSGQFNYNLMLKPDTSKLQAQSAVARLTARIAGLEKTIGENAEDMSILSMETNRKTLTEAVSVLSAKTTILVPKNLDHVEGRLAVLQQKLNQTEVGVLEGEGEDQEHIEKVLDLAKLSDKSEQWVSEIPDVIDRMEALSPLHSQAAELSQSILELETVQKQLIIQLSNNSSLLKEIEKKFQGNLANIEKNFDNLESRIQAVKAAK